LDTVMITKTCVECKEPSFQRKQSTVEDKI
jgi:uncharacterized Zn finger protein (UPF0148 family)